MTKAEKSEVRYPSDPYRALASAVLRHALDGAKKGDVLDMLWLLTPEAENWIDYADLVSRDEFVEVVVEQIKRKNG